MNAKTMFPKELISGADVHDAKGRPTSINATIAGIRQIEVGPEKEKRWALLFLGTDRKLTLNVTNNEKLCDLFGNETDDWVGQRISLRGDTAKFGGKTVQAVRVDEFKAGGAELGGALGFDPDNEIPV